ncbi:MAG: DUF389 domain-containing protein, partial [Acidimicrobiales bacterium]
MGESSGEVPNQENILEEHAFDPLRAAVSRAEVLAVLRIPSAQRGLFAIVAGLVLLTWPSRTFVVTVGIAGLVILIGGVSDLWGSRHERNRAAVVKGLATALLGGLMVIYRKRSAGFLANLIAVVAAVAAVLDFVRAIRARRRGEQWLWYLSRAMIEGLVAVATIAIGSFTVEVVLFAGAILWIATGVITIWHSILIRDSDAPHTIDPARIAYEWFQARDLGDEDRSVVVRNLIFEGDDFRLRATRFIALMSFSTAIAAFGIQTDSTAVVIGAMLVAPLMTPIMATSVSLVMGWKFRATRSLSLVFAGVLVSVFIAYVIGRYLPSFIDTVSNSQINSRVSPTL